MEMIMDAYSFLSKYLSFLFLYLSMCCFQPRLKGRRHLGFLLGAVAITGTLLQVLDFALLNRYGYFLYLLTTMVIGLPFVLWYYQAEARPKVLLYIIYFIFLAGTRIFSSNFLRLLFNLTGRDMAGYAYILLCDAASFGVLALLCVFLYRSRFETSGLRSSEYYLFTAIGVADFASFFILGESSLGRSEAAVDIWALVLCQLIILCTAWILCMVMFRYSVMQKTAKERERIIQSLQMQEHYLQQVEESLSQYREIRHELKNTLFYMDELVREEKYPELQRYVQDRLIRQDSITDVVDVGRPVVSALLGQKLSFAKEKGITMEIQALLPESLKIPDIHLCTILSNLLDNAIRESAKVEGGQIQVLMKPVKGYFCIRVANTARENILRENPSLATTKKDSKNHGLGLKVVRSLVQEYDGIMDIGMEGEHMFFVECMLRCE